MSSYITCKLEIKNISMIKKVLETMGLAYTEGELKARGYGSKSRDVDLLVKQSELNKIKAGRYGDMGFKYNSETETYDIIIDHMDKKLIDNINQLYAVETIKNFATANMKSYTISGMDNAIGNEEITVEVFA